MLLGAVVGYPMALAWLQCIFKHIFGEGYIFSLPSVEPCGFFCHLLRKWSKFDLHNLVSEASALQAIAF